MRQKLQKFTNFTATLLPHETSYLLAVQQFQDPTRLEILKEVHQNCLKVDQDGDYDTRLDKRKYSNLKKWIVQRLDDIDVDAHYEWMSETDRQIMTDSIGLQEEKHLLKAIRNYEHPIFFFSKFYELVLNYRHFLLVRMRYADHALVDQFLKNYKEEYEKSRAVNERIHEATLDIVRQYAENNTESKKWEDWLTEVFFDESLDGENRYLALVRLIFIAFNYRQYDQLLEKFDYLDKMFAEGKFYSKRILLNYYSNRLLLHSHYRQFDKAEYYGYLSIREKNYDFIYYVNNLAAILLRRHKYTEALSVMKDAYPEMKTTQSFHNKIGFVSFYIKSLSMNDRFKNAENYAESFLRAYKKEVFEYRWHTFFSAYLEVLLHQNKYRKMLKVVRQNHLLDRDKKQKDRANYLPTIPWHFFMAEVKEQIKSEADFVEEICSYLESLEHDVTDRPHLVELLYQVRKQLPNAFNRIEERLRESRDLSLQWLEQGVGK
jgi:hypothetical protein